LLWSRGTEARHASLPDYSRYDPIQQVEKLLLDKVVKKRSPRFDLTTMEDCKAELHQALCDYGVVELSAPLSNAAGLQDALLEVCLSRVDVGSLFAYPRVASLQRSRSGWIAELELEERLR